MEDALALLKREGPLRDSSDASIAPGSSISNTIRQKMEEADIIVFLLSPDFIASDECMTEWRRAKELSANKPILVRIPIVVRNCAWKDLLADDDIKALPEDGRALSSYENRDVGWQEVYEGIKTVISQLRSNFEMKQSFWEELQSTDFISERHILLQDIFVFLNLQSNNTTRENLEVKAERVTDLDALLRKKHTFVHGIDKSGKTALAKYIVLQLAGQSKPVIYVDLNEVPQRAKVNIFDNTYINQFNGDYSLWNQQGDKTLVLDNLSGRSDLLNFLLLAKENFERIIVTSSSPMFYSYFVDEPRLADFEFFEITPLSQSQQEALIRKRLSVTRANTSLTDGDIDKVEARVNSVIIDNQVVPRYPFFVLCILQTLEAYMPAGLTITSYGHCYQALIVASLVRAGIANEDSDINACFNYAEELAFEIYGGNNRTGEAPLDLADFNKKYREKYIIANATLNRLRHKEFGLVDGEGRFRSTYMHYFFLGRYLSRDGDERRRIIRDMSRATYIAENYLTLLFTIHHTNDERIIDEILLGTMTTLEDVRPATLDPSETRRFGALVAGMPKEILSSNSVEAERTRQRDIKDDVELLHVEEQPVNEIEEPEIAEVFNGIYRVLKNNEVTGRILKNRYGSIEKSRIEEIIEIMADGGLRLVNTLLAEEDEVRRAAQYLKAKNPAEDIEQIRNRLEMFSFLWTMMNVEAIVAAINLPEMKMSVDAVTARAGSPAHDIIRYFTVLDAASELTETERRELDRLWRKHRDPFVRGVLSLRTQMYMNTAP